MPHDVRLSKVLAVALRHRPEAFGLELDDHGWVAVDDLLAALRARGGRTAGVDRAAVEEVVASQPRPRYELRGDRIRARYGHSVPVAVDAAPAAPPEVLWHGTSRRAWQAIAVEGLRPMGRQHVHLSVDRGQAEEVGRRHARRSGGLVVLRVDAGRAHRDGVAFVPAATGVWLAGAVPPRHLTQSSSTGERPPQ